VDPERARELLQRERLRIERSMAALDRDGPLEGEGNREPGDLETEDLYQDEFDEGRREELQSDLLALERAEERLRAGTYGRSIESGKPIPDARLEALPTAERTVEEEEAFRRG
jgi:DnaK suppressor protein